MKYSGSETLMTQLCGFEILLFEGISETQVSAAARKVKVDLGLELRPKSPSLSSTTLLHNNSIFQAMEELSFFEADEPVNPHQKISSVSPLFRFRVHLTALI